jgi:hypothetical protein
MKPTKSRDQQISNKSAGVENSQPAYKEKRKKKGKKKKNRVLLAKPKRAFLDGFELQTFHNSRDEDTTTRQPRKGLVQTLHMSGL